MCTAGDDVWRTGDLYRRFLPAVLVADPAWARVAQLSVDRGVGFALLHPSTGP